MDMKKNPLSFQLKLDPEDFLPATKNEQEQLVVMRESVSFWKDGMRRFRKNKVAMVSLVVIVIIMIFAFIVPSFYPYTYRDQIRGSENLAPMQYSQQELERMEAGESVFPHICGTDKLGRDYAIRLMLGARISLLVGLVASFLILIIGSVYGSISAFFGGWVDMIMMRITDIIYTIPDILLIILISFALKDNLQALAATPAFKWLNTLGPNLVSIFIVFALLYWVSMARIVRSQVLALKEAEYVTAARALGASNGRIIKKHLLTNCIGTLIVTTTLQIPSSILPQSIMSCMVIGVSVPLQSLRSHDTEPRNGMKIYPCQQYVPAILISVIILSFNLLGDGLRDAFDPKLKD